MEKKREPLLSIREGINSISVFENTSKDGKKYLSCSLQKAKKINDQWEYEKINYFSDDLAKVGLMLLKAHSKINDLNSNKNSNSFVDVEQVKKLVDEFDNGTKEVYNEAVDDNIPF